VVPELVGGGNVAVGGGNIVLGTVVMGVVVGGICEAVAGEK
jgi:hypothetical protein